MAVLLAAGMVGLRAPSPTKVLLVPRLWMKRAAPFRMFPAVGVEGTSERLPVMFGFAAPFSSAVRREDAFTPSSAPMRESLLFVAVTTALKLAFTSDALAVEPELKVVIGPTGSA